MSGRYAWIPMAVALLGCPSEPEPVEDPTPPGCGDSVLTSVEECDDGRANSDTTADACRLDCTLPTCGDGVVDDGEQCDDGVPFSGDGCSESCRPEDGRLEAEPNNDVASAEALTSGEEVTGGLPDDDIDCFSFDVAERGWMSADVRGEDEGTCPSNQTFLHLYDPDGAQVAVAGPTLEEGCSPLEPILQPGARFMTGGTWTLCVEGSWGEPVPGYTLGLEVGEDTCDLPDSPFTTDDDTDADGTPDVCDEDDDGDGLLDGADDCPTVPNNGDEIVLTTDPDGLVGDWLLAGPFTGHETTESCRCSEDEILGDDAEAVPALGDVAGEGQAWFVGQWPGRVNFLNVMAGPTDREVYAATWVRSETEQAVTMAIGPDDGARVWVNGEEIIDVVSCQGTNLDQFTAETTLLEGWNQVLVKVRDHGGAWAMYFRFLDSEEAPLVGFDVSLSADGVWAPGQGDTDGDGIGDVCDPTPLGTDL